MDTAIAGFLGAIIGAAASLIGLAIQQHYHTKRERLKIASDLGLSEYKYDLENIAARGGGLVAPISAYVIYHARILDEMAKGPISPETIKTLHEERDKVLEAFVNTSRLDD
ncbi:MAG: hypothetical protein ABW152_18055 [Candidatus Thiodiazotropha endolucinida]